MNKYAIVLTDGLLQTDYAKTAHGLIRGSDRFKVVAIIDAIHSGSDAGEVLDGKKRDIPVVSSFDEAIARFKTIDYLVVGVATVGGVLSNSLLDIIRQGIKKGLNIVNGLHHKLSEHNNLEELARENKVELIDIRKPKPIKDLHFWTGEIFNVDVPIVAVLGMDCAMGKRTTAHLLKEACTAEGIYTEMIYTGQTGWMQGYKYGFIFDSTLNDFVSGELENAIVTCWKEEKPDIIFLEGQSSLRNPSGPCGSELLISGNAKYVILMHAPARQYFDNDQSWGTIPTVESEIEIIEKYGSKVIGLALNTNELTIDEAKAVKVKLEKSLSITVVLPIIEGVNRLIPTLKSLRNENKRN